MDPTGQEGLRTAWNRVENQRPVELKANASKMFSLQLTVRNGLWGHPEHIREFHEEMPNTQDALCSMLGWSRLGCAVLSYSYPNLPLSLPVKKCCSSQCVSPLYKPFQTIIKALAEAVKFRHHVPSAFLRDAIA